MLQVGWLPCKRTMSPCRGWSVRLAPTLKRIVPLPWPVAGGVKLIQLALVVAVQLQPLCVLTTHVPFPPITPKVGGFGPFTE